MLIFFPFFPMINLEISPALKNKKSELLTMYRHSVTLVSEQICSAPTPQKKAKVVNDAINDIRDEYHSRIIEQSNTDHWSKQDLLETILMVDYSSFVVMLESRNTVWPYEYMTFSRRIGELWEPFCKLCFEFPINELSLYAPPEFEDVKAALIQEIASYIAGLNITKEEETRLSAYFSQVWNLVTSGEIQLKSDLHFLKDGHKYVVDFKSGFGSNEKGNTNRLLMVGKIYQEMKDEYNCLLFVRATENNHYLETLNNSGLWSVTTGEATYAKIREYTGYNISQWIHNNINWLEDFSPAMSDHVRGNALEQYLVW